MDYILDADYATVFIEATLLMQSELFLHFNEICGANTSLRGDNG